MKIFILNVKIFCFIMVIPRLKSASGTEKILAQFIFSTQIQQSLKCMSESHLINFIAWVEKLSAIFRPEVTKTGVRTDTIFLRMFSAIIWSIGKARNGQISVMTGTFCHNKAMKVHDNAIAAYCFNTVAWIVSFNQISLISSV